MRTYATVVVFWIVGASPVFAQPNPFKLPKLNLKGEVNYQLTGDQQGTAQTAFDGDRYLTRSTSSIKMMGKETKESTWSLFTADSMYTADLDKKKGTVMPNLLPLYAKAYDGLDGAAKKRFHGNVEAMGALVSKAFDIGSMGSVGEKLGDETVAGEVCENRQFAGFTVCSMKRGPRIALKTSGDLLCYRFEQTATSVSLSAPPASVFERPAGVVFRPMAEAGNADSAAQGFVGYLASQALTDSLAAAKAELEKAKADAAAKGESTEMTQEQKEQMKQACETLKNFDMGAVMANAMKAMKQQMADAAVDAAKQGAANKLKGLIKKPKIPF